MVLAALSVQRAAFASTTAAREAARAYATASSDAEGELRAEAAVALSDDGTNFRGQKRSNNTHRSTTDSDARLYKKSYGKESKLAYLGHVLVENRNGLIAAAMATTADGHAERDAALLMLQHKQKSRSQREGAV